LKEVSYDHQGKNTVQTVILWNCISF